METMQDDLAHIDDIYDQAVHIFLTMNGALPVFLRREQAHGAFHDERAFAPARLPRDQFTRQTPIGIQHLDAGVL